MTDDEVMSDGQPEDTMPYYDQPENVHPMRKVGCSSCESYIHATASPYDKTISVVKRTHNHETYGQVPS